MGRLHLNSELVPTLGGAYGSTDGSAAGKETHPPETASLSQNRSLTASFITGQKRKACSDGASATPAGPNKRKASNSRPVTASIIAPPSAHAPGASDALTHQIEAAKKPRLTIPDLEFNYDRSQLRDPRPTPGRATRDYARDSWSAAKA
ncbi:hypothetical protein BU23DRAFT_566845 [Bimuria novae-zelandiae CBS 107.79]|uniref:Uncharacterized protein n=1 Tax=Bimuria novae-zelandiae CBS 107.79 TaxID=1447943 RepID=A0A6A5VCR7_9PLEO|nr:hypothetical protein BU23DRAFT_566845 [Bimuria novae-zelandiae CBS 107.79]